MQVPATSNTGTNSGVDWSQLSSQVMSQQDFLKLLVAQMTSQNPIDPLNNQDLLSQMVQFSTLQQNTSLQTAITGMQASQGLLQANALLGREVTVQADPTTTKTGVVSGVQMNSGSASIVVNGVVYDLSQVLAISTPTTSP